MGCSGCRHGTVILDTGYSGSGTERITNRHSGLVLDVQNPNTSNGARVGQYAWNGGAWQRWTVEDVGSGYVRVRSAHSGKCLDGSGTANGALRAAVGLQRRHQPAVQPAERRERIRADRRAALRQVPGRPGWSTADGTVLNLWDCTGGNNQLWARSAV